MDFREDDSRTLERQENMNEQYNTIEEAIEEGVQFKFLTNPAEFTGEK